MNKNIFLSKFKKGHKLLLETKECVFDIEIISPKKATVIITGGRRFTKPTEAVVVGAYGRRNVNDDDTLLEDKQIEQNVGVEFNYHDKENITSSFVTSPVISAMVYGKDWHYEVWENLDKANTLHKSLEEARARIRINTDTNNEGTLS